MNLILKVIFIPQNKMARAHEYKRSLNAVITTISIEKSESNQIKQEPCSENDEDFNDTCTPFSEEHKDNTSNNMSGNNCDGKRASTETIVNIINNTVKKKDLSIGQMKTENRKRKRHDSYCSEDDTSYKSNKRYYTKPKPQKLTRNSFCKSNSKIVSCQICFLYFKHRFALRQHRISYDRCKEGLQDLSSTSQKYSCHFCPRTFKIKRNVQGHLFHIHRADLGIDIKKSSRSDPHNSHSGASNKKKMRQTTLTEYILSRNQSECSKVPTNSNNSHVRPQGIIKQETDLNDSSPDLSKITSFVDSSHKNEKQSKITTSNQPFVKIHVDSSMIRELLSIPYDSLESNNKSNNSGKVYELRSLHNSKKVNINDKLQNILSMCKECIVPLTRCDDKLVTRSTSRLNTSPVQALRQNNYISLKRERRHSRRKNAKFSSETSMPKDSNLARTTLRGSLSISFSSKSSVSKLEDVKHLNEDLVNHPSLYEQLTSDMEQKKSSFQEEPQQDLATAQSIQPIKDLKLKKLRVSLIKLPEIKKEVVTSDITDSNENVQCTVCGMSFFTERNKDKHVRKFHTAYISSICKARCRSKRYMLKHYLREHCVWGSTKCCVCRQFFQTRLSLKRHLLLHCIKIVLRKNEKCPMNVLRKCNFIQTIRKRTTCSKSHLIEHKNVDDIGQENLNVNSDDNIPSQVAERGDSNNEVLSVVDDQEECQTVSDEKPDLFEDNTVIYLSPNNDNEIMEQEETPIMDPLYTVSNSSSPFDPNKETQIILTSNPNTDNNVSVSILPNIVGNIKQKYPCSICGQQFQKLESLLQHKRTYTQSLQHSCTTCGMFFSNKKILRNHINTTHHPHVCDLYTLHCQFCNQGFRTENNLRIHELHYHATAETIDKEKISELLQMFSSENRSNTFQTFCHICGLIFNTYERYQLHYMYYRQDYVFSCNFCEQRFQGLYMLHHHKKLCHYPESTRNSYKYHCSNCYEGFMIESHLHGHMSHVHSNKQQTASSNVALSSVRYDSKKKSYVCLKCHLEFLTIVKLMVHVEYYTDYGNYQCHQCPRRCCTLAVLNEHVQLSHSDTVRNGYKCGSCDEVLASTFSLSCHQKHVHPCSRSPQDFTLSCRTLDTNLQETELDAITVTDNQVLPDTMEPGKELVLPNKSIVLIQTSMPVTEKPNISCPICAVKFEKEEYLTIHLAEYLNVGDYSCDECQRRFANSQLLRKHMENHARADMPRTKYHCSVCNENFQFLIVYESHVAHMHARVFFNDVSSENV